jgi:2-oxo-3-hexenedioate decarboxylase
MIMGDRLSPAPEPESLDACAKRLYQASREVSATRQISAGTAWTLDDGYNIQSLMLQQRIDSGERVVGLKMGFTSRAKMAQMGVSSTIFGRLTDAMMVDEGGSTPHRAYVHPRVEPELAFVLRRRLCGRVSLAEALGAVEYVTAALEIIDSRYRDFKFSLIDVVADNASASGFVMGAPRLPGTDIDNLGMLLSISGEVRQVGSTAAILGNPWRSLVAAAALVERYELELPAGAIVLAGAATEAVAVCAGERAALETQRLSPVEVIFDTA